MIGRRAFIGWTGFSLLGVSSEAVMAQSPTVRRIGFLVPNPAVAGRRLDALRAGMREVGYVEKKNLVIEMRWPGGREKRARDIVEELIDAHTEVTVIHGGVALLATLRITRAQHVKMPVVMATCPDGSQFADSPSGGPRASVVTGLTDAADTVPAQLQLLTEVRPNLARLAVLANPQYPGHPAIRASVAMAVKKTAIAVTHYDALTQTDIDTAFAALVKAGAQAVLVAVDPSVAGAGRQIADLGLKYKLPTLFAFHEHVEAGGLMSYGENVTATYRRAAVYVHKILMGTPVAALRVEQANNVELFVNRKTAAALNITLPVALLKRADKLI